VSIAQSARLRGDRQVTAWAVGWKFGAKWKFGVQIRHPYFHLAPIFHSNHSLGAYMGVRGRVGRAGVADG
jgi:hypothetical protein